MKKTLLSLAVIAMVQFSYAQFSSSGGNTTTSDNVGIGTTSPQVPLHVNGAIISATPVSNIVGIGTTWADNANYNFIGYSGYWGLRTATNNSYNLDVFNGNSPITAMTVLQGGNVGIGTTSPVALLQIGPLTNSTTHYQTVFNAYDSATGYPQLLFNNSNSNYIAIGNSTAGDLVLGTTTAVNSAWASQQLIIKQSTGDVAIGTDDPQGYKLAVNGSAIAESVTVKLHSSWPDFVFKPKYNLLSLTEVKTYINNNQRLPDMPSEQDVAKNGINLGEMVKLQTKKIEELTLYLIAQQKQMEKQDKRIAALEKNLTSKKQQNHFAISK